MIVHRYDSSELARVLEGVRENGTILLAGDGGIGKSTAAAELAAAVAYQRSGLAYWLDRDQQAHDLIAATFERVHADMDRVVLVEEAEPLEQGFEPLTWEGALAHVPATAACIVLDSLETWAESYAEQPSVARAVAGHAATVKVVLCGTNSEGEVEGRAQLRRVGDAIVVLRPKVWDIQKCRWLPECPKQVPRQPADEHHGSPDAR
jgi:hypothetical protein